MAEEAACEGVPDEVAAEAAAANAELKLAHGKLVNAIVDFKEFADVVFRPVLRQLRRKVIQDLRKRTDMDMSALDHVKYPAMTNAFKYALMTGPWGVRRRRPLDSVGSSLWSMECRVRALQARFGHSWWLHADTDMLIVSIPRPLPPPGPLLLLEDGDEE